MAKIDSLKDISQAVDDMWTFYYGQVKECQIPRYSPTFDSEVYDAYVRTTDSLVQQGNRLLQRIQNRLSRCVALGASVENRSLLPSIYHKMSALAELFGIARESADLFREGGFVRESALLERELDFRFPKRTDSFIKRPLPVSSGSNIVNNQQSVNDMQADRLPQKIAETQRQISFYRRKYREGSVIDPEIARECLEAIRPLREILVSSRAMVREEKETASKERNRQIVQKGVVRKKHRTLPSGWSLVRE